MNDSSGRETLVPPTRTPLLGVMALLGAASATLLVVALLSDPTLTAGMRVTAIALGAAWGLASTAVALRLLSPRTGIFLQHGRSEEGALGFCITGPKDIWWIPRERMTDLRVQAAPAPGAATIERWLCLLRLRGDVAVVVLESASRDFVEDFTEALRDKLALSPREDDPPPLAPAEQALAVRRGGALQGIVLLFGIALLLTGSLALSQLEREPVIGFLLGPLLVMLGLTLTATAVVKRFSTECLRFDGLKWHHHYRLGRLRWGQRSVRARSPLWRIVMLGARGAYLELKGEDGSLILGASVTATSRDSLETLSRLPERFLDPAP